ncbi:MAG: acyl-CoA dehydrogenase family protein [Gammaproteobacteria bacterium]
MNLNYSDEQLMLQEQIAKFCLSDYSFALREKIIAENSGHSIEIWNQFAELGWLALPFSEKNGGLDFGPIELSILFEEFGKALVVEPYLSSVVMSGYLLDHTSLDYSSLIQEIISGKTHVSTAFAEPNGGYEFLKPQTQLSKGKLNGSKSIVLNAKNSKYLIVTCHENSELKVVILEQAAKGVSINNFKTFDGQTCSDVSFENVSVDEDSVLFHGSDAEIALNQMFNYAILCVSAEAVGCMSEAVKKTVSYTKERQQFGVPISSFQVLQHRMVEMFMEAEISKSLLIKTMLQLNSKDPAGEKTLSSLKAQVGKSGKFVCQEAVQLHGGMGVSNEMSIGHYLKRITAIDSQFGNRSYHLKKFMTL